MADRMHILLVEDQPRDAELVEHEVRAAIPSGVFRRVETREEFLAAMEEFRPELILSDYRLPHFDGMAALKLAIERAPNVPFVLVTGSMNEETAVACMRAGAWDYVLKDRLRRLGPAVLAVLEQKRIRLEHRRAEEALRESEERFRVLVERAPDAIVVYDVDLDRWVDVNANAEGLFGAARAELLAGGPLRFYASVQPDGRPVADSKRENDGRALAGEQVVFERIICTTTGREVPCEVRLTRLPAAGRRLLRASYLDITERKRAEGRILQLNRLLRTVSEVNQLIVHETARDRLLGEACRILVERGQFMMAWVGLKDESSGLVQPVAVAGADAGYTEAVRIRWDDSPAGHGPVGTVIRSGRHAVFHDTGNPGHYEPWCEEARRRGWRTQAAFPLRVEARVIGVLSVYARGVDAVDEEEVALFDELAMDLGYALQTLADRETRRRAEEAVHEQLDELQRWYKAMLGRESRILELKHEVNELLVQAGRPPKYADTEGAEKEKWEKEKPA